jgi:hypothetical protein
MYIEIEVDDYPGWETSTSPYRLTMDGTTYRHAMDADQIHNNIAAHLRLKGIVNED